MVRIFHPVCFWGTVTALAGIIAKRFGPEVGRLFLAFPAIFPAAATLIEKDEKEKKERAGQHGKKSGRAAAGVDAAGAALGSIGLGIFAVIVWQRLPHSALALVLTGATLAWLVASVAVWELCEKVCRRARTKWSGVQTANSAPPRSNSPSTSRRLDE